MGIGIKNINYSSDYHSYLKSQIERKNDLELGQANYQSYLMTGLSDDEIQAISNKKSAQNFDRYTRCQGELAKELGLDGSLSADKLKRISDLENGIAPETKPFKDTKKRYRNTVKDLSSSHLNQSINGVITKIPLNDDDIKRGFTYFDNKVITFQKSEIKYFELKVSKADYKNGYIIDSNGDKQYFYNVDVTKKELNNHKTSTEITFSVDSTFSYAYQSMNDDDKKRFEQAFFESANFAFESEISNNFLNSKGHHGQVMSYDILHTTNRQGDPFIHIHKNVSNIMKMDDGSYSATELDVIKQKAFHKKVDAIFKAKFVEILQKEFPDLAIESFDQHKDSVKSYDEQRVKDYRVAYDKESLTKIYARSTTTEKVDRVVQQQLKSELERYTKAKEPLNEKRKLGELSDEDYYKKLDILNQQHTNNNDFINSRKNKAEIQKQIKQDKSDESIDDSNERLNNLIQSMNLAESSIDERGIINPNAELGTATDNLIIEKLTQTDPIFAENNFIAEYTLHYGLSGKERAIALLKDCKNDAELIKYTSLVNGKEITQYTSRTLLIKEQQNLSMIHKTINTESNVKIDNIDYEIAKLEQSIGATYVKGQKDLIKSVFGDSNFTLAIGVPGAGKSFAISGATKLAKDKGFKVFGVSPTNKVSRDLASIDGLDSSTIQSFNIQLAKGYIKLDSKSIVFIDESSMVDSRTWNEFLTHTTKAGCKVVMVGDPNQLSSVGAGGLINELIKDKELLSKENSVVVLDEISRQKNDVAKAIAMNTSLSKLYKDKNFDEIAKVKASGDHIKKAFELMEQNNLVKSKYQNQNEKLQGLVSDYMSNSNVAKEKLILCSTNQSVELINNAIQTARKNKGEISSIGINNGVKDFYVGDRIVMLDNKKDKKPYNPDYDKVLWNNFIKTDAQKRNYKIHKTSPFMTDARYKELQKQAFEEYKAKHYEKIENNQKLKFEQTEEYKEIFNEFLQTHDETKFKELYEIRYEIYKQNNELPVDQGYSNGDIGTIKEIINGKAVVAFDNGDIRTIEINEKVDLSYALTVHKSQGMTVNDTLLWMESSPVSNQHLTNVALTRNRHNVKAYSTEQEYEQVKTEYARQDNKVSLIQLGKETGIIKDEIVKEPEIKVAEPERLILTVDASYIEKANSKLDKLVKPKPKYQEVIDPKFAEIAVKPVLKIEPKPMPDFLKAQRAQEYQQAEIARKTEINRLAEIAKQAELKRQSTISKSKKKQKGLSLGM